MQQLEDLQRFIEADFSLLTDTFQYARNLFPYLERTTDESEKARIQWEIAVMHYTFGRGNFNPVFRQPDSTGLQIHEHPSIGETNEEICEYLSERASSTSNDYLIIRYRVLLWNAPVRGYKNENHAKSAIDAFIRIIENLKNSAEPDDAYLALLSALELSSQVKAYRLIDLKDIANHLIWHTPDFSNFLKIQLLGHLLEYRQIKADFFTNTLDLCEEIANHWIENNDIFLSEVASNIGLRISSKLGQNPRFWHNKFGEAYEKFAEHRQEDEDGMLTLSYLNKALQSYRAAGNDTKMEEVGNKYEQQQLKLSEVSVPINAEPIQEVWKMQEAEADNLMRFDSKSVFQYLEATKNVLPKATALYEMVSNSQNMFMQFAQRIEFERNKNIRDNPETDEERELREVLFIYTRQVRIFTYPHLKAIFEKGIFQQKINFDSLMGHWASHSWLGQPLAEHNTAGKERHYNWLGLMAPAILEFFTQKESDLISRGLFTNYILCIDSLTLKFEGALRDFARIAGVNIRKTQRGVMHLVHIEDILTDPKIKGYFDEDDLLFFKFLFTRNGANLRNNVAHGFFRFEDYSEAWMILLLFAFLRLGRYRLKITQTSQTESSPAAR